MQVEKLFQDFIHYVETEKLFVEGIAIGDEKKVLMEHHFLPDQARNIYSHTKSYTSTGVGIAIEQGKMNLDDKIADYFPESLPEKPDARLFDISLRHLLTMSSGFNHAYLMNADRRAGTGAPDYLKYMLSRSIETDPGSQFHYSSADSILLVRMVEKATGLPFGQFMYENVFSRLEQGWPMWEYDPMGHPNGGGGMCMHLTEMMKIAQVYLADGCWKGERIINSDWVKQASTKQIENSSEDIWVCGYGYQFWMSPYPNSYRADGAYGQISTVLPEKGLVVAIQCPEWGDFQKVKMALHEQVLTQL